jgi:hypothetical protein
MWCESRESSGDAEIHSSARALIEAFEIKNSGVLRVFAGRRNRVNGVAISTDGKRGL